MGKMQGEVSRAGRALEIVSQFNVTQDIPEFVLTLKRKHPRLFEVLWDEFAREATENVTEDYDDPGRWIGGSD